MPHTTKTLKYSTHILLRKNTFWIIYTFWFISFQSRGTPKRKLLKRGKKRLPTKEDGPVPKKLPRKGGESIHEVMVEEVEDAFEEEDEEDEEEIPPTQLPLPTSQKKLRETRASSRQQKPSAAGRYKPPEAFIQLTQKRKDNISSCFLTSLSNKGVSEELRKTKR